MARAGESARGDSRAESASEDSRDSATSWSSAIVGGLIAIIGVALTGGGVWLAILGGSLYYAIAGVGLLVAGFLLVRGERTGIWLYFAVWLFTVMWALWEVGMDGWALVPRVVAPTVLLIPVLLLAFALPRRSRTVRAAHTATAAAALVALGFGGYYASGHFAEPALAQADTRGGADGDGATKKTAGDGSARPAQVAAADAGRNPAAGRDWPVYGGSDAGRRYSPLDQINVDNVAKLEKVWSYRSGDMPSEEAEGKYSPENTPLKIGNHLFVCTAKNIMISIDAKSGEEEWRYDPKVSDDAIPYGATCRGVAYYKRPDAAAGDACAARIIEGTLDARLIAVDAATGKPCEGFGDSGIVDLKKGIGETVPGWYAVTAPPTIVRGIAVVGAQVKDGQAEDSPSGVIRGYDAVTGELAWAWDMGHPEWTGLPPEGKHYARGTPNMWTMAAGDEKLGYVYLPLGNSAVDYYGGNRKDYENEYSSSLVAIDVTTGKPVWHFQTVRYDLWDYDLGSQPTLVDLPTDSGDIPAVVLASKQGQIYVLDRRTGESLFPVEDRRVPVGGVEPDNLATTQPYSTYAHLDGPPLKERDMWGMSPLDQLWCRIQFHRAYYEGEYTPPTADRPYIEYPGYNGGSDWGSLAVDPVTGIIVANYNDMPNFNKLIPREKANEMGLKPIDEQEKGGDSGSNAEGEGDAQAGSPYAIHVNAGWRVGLTGMLCKEPPYGGIRAIDLKTGRTLWDHALGSARNNGPFGIPSMLPIRIGTPNNGGPLVTAGGLIFIAATTDDMFRAFDARTGDLVWETELPAGGQTTPITYEVDGRQYVAIAPGGHHFMETEIGDYVIAYALPEGG